MVDARTHSFYEANAESIAERHHTIESPSARYFERAFVAGGRILDLGAGAGRDLAALLAAGYPAVGLEPCAELRRCALERHPELEGRLFAGALPDDLPEAQLVGAPFDGLLCSAVLQHLPSEELPTAARTFGRLLAPEGRLLISLPVDRKVDAQGRDRFDRLFSGLGPDALGALLDREGLSELSRHDDLDALGRSGTTWVTMIFAR